MDWTQINYRIFEKLACEYAQNIHPEYTWIATNQSWDGNKDCEFIDKIKAIDYTYKGWVEAKYTTVLDNAIPLSHMDSTLVSGILDGQVVYIMFVTNGHITKDFHRRAKAILVPYKIKAEFIEGDILEEWLSQNREIKEAYFNSLPKDKISKSKKIEIDDICFFEPLMTPSNFTHPINSLIVRNEYYLYASIKSNFRTYVSYYFCNPCIERMSEDNELQINPGYNSYVIKCHVKNIFEGKFYLKIEGVELPKEIYSKAIDIYIKEDFEPIIIHSKQTQIIQEIYNYSISPSSSSCILSVSGDAGTGKSHLFRSIIQSLTTENQEIHFIQFSENIAENASYICQLILFLNFGNLYTLSQDAFLRLIQNTVNLPIHIYKELRVGANNQMVALNVINKLIKLLQKEHYSLLLNNNLILKKNISYIILDDCHKLSSDAAIIADRLMTEFHEKSQGQVLIVGYRKNEFKDESWQQTIYKYQNKAWNIDTINNYDIDESIKKNCGKAVMEIARLFPRPVTILHLGLLIKKLVHQSINKQSPEIQITTFASCYADTNVQNGIYVKDKIEKCQYKELLYLIYKLESGIDLNNLKSFYGEQCDDGIRYLMNENLIRFDRNMVKPFHDIYLCAFSNSSIYKTYDFLIVKLFKFYMDNPSSEHSNIISNIISILLIDNKLRSNNVIEYARQLCKIHYDSSQYIAAKTLSKALLLDIDKIELNNFSDDDIKTLYIYAMSIKYSETHEGSNHFLDLICKIANVRHLNSELLGYSYEAYSELLNNAIWMMDEQKSIKYIEYLEHTLSFHFKNESEHKVNAYLNLLNRKALYTTLFTENNPCDAFKYAIEESVRLCRNDYFGYAMMDQAKSILPYNMEKALRLLQDAYCIFETSDKYLKRRYDCMSEIVFIETYLYKTDFDRLYQIQNETYLKGFFHVYAKVTLKILALELVYNYDIDSIELRLKKLFIQYPDIKNRHRLNAFMYHLWSGIYYKKGDLKKQYKYAYKYKELVKHLNNSYNHIAIHNCEELAGSNIKWCCENANSECFWLDVRLW